MKALRKILIFLITAIISCLLASNMKFNIYSSPSLPSNSRKAVKMAILLSNLEDPFFALTRKSLDDIQNENIDKVNFVFFDSKNNVAIQNEGINSALQQDIDLIALSLLSPTEETASEIINRAKQKNIPIILLGLPTEIVSKVSGIYNRTAFIAPNSEQAGTAQGEIIINLWNNNKKVIDKNNDNILRYIILEGVAGSEVATERTRGSLAAIRSSGINAEELEHINANWSEELARSTIENLFLKYSNKVEAIISNNDSMAIGAVKALQKYGYNKGDKSKYVPVVGIDGLPEARDLIDKGFMVGTVIQDPRIFADQIYLVGMNLFNNLNPIANTSYEFKNGQIIAIFPVEIYTGVASTS